MTQPARTRAAWGTISRERVIGVAAQAVEAGRFEEMTIRSLARELLGVAPMSLYRHVRDKDDLLDEVVDRLLSSAWRPEADEADWVAWVTEAASRLRAFLRGEPAALHVYLRQPPMAAVAQLRMDAMLRVLGAAGLEGLAAERAYGAIQVYTVGFAALEASRSRWLSLQDPDDARLQQLAALTSVPQFDEGLAYLIDGIQARTRDAV